MTLATVWFCFIAFLWTGYLVLEGFDFGIGILLPRLGGDQTGRRVLLSTIGPVWDGNEVWLIVAAGATFAAFPDWYATLTSGFYLPLLAILVALICRGVALEYRGKRDDAGWRARCDAAITAGSAVPALLWGLILGAMVGGVPLDAAGEATGTPAVLLGGYPLLCGATTLGLCLTHGGLFAALKTRGAIRDAARTSALRTGPPTAAATAALVVWTLLLRGSPAAAAVGGAGLACLLAALVASRIGRDGWAFAGTAAAVGLTVAGLFTSLYPDVMPATDPAHSLTVANAAASGYTLRVLSWAALACTPLVVAYQAWSYWVFRRRVGGGQIGAGS